MVLREDMSFIAATIQLWVTITKGYRKMGRTTDLRNQLQRVVNSHHDVQKFLPKGQKTAPEHEKTQFYVTGDHLCAGSIDHENSK